MSETRPKHCGGCGETDPAKRCIGCLADFGPGLTSEGEAARLGKTDRDMRDGMDCNYPECGCCHDAKCSDAPQPAQPDLEERIDNAVQAMAETHSTWESRCHAIVAALGFDFGWDEPKHDDAQAHIAALTAKVEELTRGIALYQEMHATKSNEKVAEFRRAETAEARNAELVEALEASRQVLAKLLSAGHNSPSATPEEIDAAFWSVDAALGGQSNEA